MKLIGNIAATLNLPLANGSVATSGLRLFKRPLLSSVSEVKYAFQTDARFFDSRKYKQLADFLPVGFDFPKDDMSYNLAIAKFPRQELAFDFVFSMFGQDYMDYLTKTQGTPFEGLLKDAKFDFVFRCSKNGVRESRGGLMIKNRDIQEKKGDIVSYHVCDCYNNDDSCRSDTGDMWIKHAGIVVDDGRVISRWMDNGPVLVHPIKEFPQRYLDERGYSSWFEVHRCVLK
jgi:hypothetical protein